MTDDAAPAEDARPRPTQPTQSPRDRQVRIGGNLASYAYNELVARLQKEQAGMSGMTVEQLARLMDTGARIEANAVMELPDDGSDVAEDLERVLTELGLEPTD